MSSGTFVVFEGLSVTGKTTTLANTSDILSSRGVSVTTVPEFSDSRIGEWVYDTIVDGHSRSFDQIGLSVFTATAADQIYEVETFVEPALRRGDVVLMDRYYYTLYVYNTKYLREKFTDPEPGLEALRNFEQLLPDPDLVVYLLLGEEEHWTRLDEIGRTPSEEDKSEIRRRRDAYEEQLEDCQATVVRQSTSAPQEEVAEQVTESILHVHRGE